MSEAGHISLYCSVTLFFTRYTQFLRDIRNTEREKIKFSGNHYFYYSQREQHQRSKSLYKTFTLCEYSQFLNSFSYPQIYPH